MRDIGLDVHRDFCEVTIWEAGELRSAGRIATTPEALELFAQSLGTDDRVALEVTGNAWEIARIIEPHVARVLVISPADTGIRQARAKTDRLDARALARLLAAGSLDGLWLPDEWTRTVRRRLGRRAQLVRARTRAKNEVHAALVRRLISKPKVADLFGQEGRRWLERLELPEEERETVESALRQVDFLEAEIAQVEALIARTALDSPEARRLMTVPGVNVITAATFLAAIGDIRRFRSPRKLVCYLGLDPKVRQSGPGPATHGRISKQGSAPARYALVEAAWSVVRQPGPMHAFYERIRARRRHQVAVVATARKLAVLFWHLLTKEEDYAYAQPSLTKKKLRRLELLAGAEKGKVRPGTWAANKAMRHAERELAEQPSAPTSAWLPTGNHRRARARHRDAHLQGRLAASSTARPRSQTLRFSSSSLAPRPTLAKEPAADKSTEHDHGFRPFHLAESGCPADMDCLRAVPRSYQVTPGHPRPATSDTAKASQATRPTA